MSEATIEVFRHVRESACPASLITPRLLFELHSWASKSANKAPFYYNGTVSPFTGDSMVWFFPKVRMHVIMKIIKIVDESCIA
jgi:hypothetical protein